MENYHLFIADENSLKFHIEYGFVGTGYKNDDFNIGLWKDIERLKIGDKIIFYVQSLKKFFGIFEVVSEPFFDNSNPLYLEQANPSIKISENETIRIKLRYRALIRPYRIYQEGVEEFDLIDILPPNTEDVLWSILYRKLKAKRGNSPLFPREFNIIENKLQAINNESLNLENYTFENGQIVENPNLLNYVGNTVCPINLKNQIIAGNYSEHHLHALLLEILPSQIFGENILWTGNEVFSGAGMQAIDLMSIEQQQGQNIYRIIEVKKGHIPVTIPKQVKKYSQWVKGRFNIQNPENTIQPIIIGQKSSARQRRNRVQRIIEFNDLNLSLHTKYFEYEVNIQENAIIFWEIHLDNLSEINDFSV